MGVVWGLNPEPLHPLLAPQMHEHQDSLLHAKQQVVVFPFIHTTYYGCVLVHVAKYAQCATGLTGRSSACSPLLLVLLPTYYLSRQSHLLRIKL